MSGLCYEYVQLLYNFDDDLMMLHCIQYFQSLSSNENYLMVIHCLQYFQPLSHYENDQSLYILILDIQVSLEICYFSQYRFIITL